MKHFLVLMHLELCHAGFVFPHNFTFFSISTPISTRKIFYTFAIAVVKVLLWAFAQDYDKLREFSLRT